MKTEILTQLCDILGLTDPEKLPAAVKSLHDRYGDAVWPNRGVIPCFCGDITRVTREKLGARPDEPVFAAAERVVAQREALAETLSSVKAELEHNRVLLGISRELCAEGAQNIDELRGELSSARASGHILGDRLEEIRDVLGAIPGQTALEAAYVVVSKIR